MITAITMMAPVMTSVHGVGMPLRAQPVRIVVMRSAPITAQQAAANP